VAAQGVGREPNKLDTPLGKFGLETSHLTELGGADRGVVLGVGEQDDPVVADELMEVDVTLGCVGLEVRGNGAQAEAAKAQVSNAQSLACLQPLAGGHIRGGTLRSHRGGWCLVIIGYHGEMMCRS
jgi:hypothetical protein